jgi:hypothetical protein
MSENTGNGTTLTFTFSQLFLELRSRRDPKKRDLEILLFGG